MSKKLQFKEIIRKRTTKYYSGFKIALSLLIENGMDFNSPSGSYYQINGRRECKVFYKGKVVDASDIFIEFIEDEEYWEEITQ